MSLFLALLGLPTKYSPAKHPTKVSHEGAHESVHSSGQGSSVLFSPEGVSEEVRGRGQEGSAGRREGGGKKIFGGSELATKFWETFLVLGDLNQNCLQWGRSNLVDPAESPNIRLLNRDFGTTLSIFLRQNSKTQSSLNFLQSGPWTFTKSAFLGLAPIR